MTLPAPTGFSARALVPRHPSSLVARVAGIVFSPRATLQAVAAAPRWLDVLALTFVITTLCSAILLETDVGQLALLDQWERTAIAFGQPVDDARYAALARASQNGAAYAVLSSLASGPLLVVVMSAILYVVFTTIRRGRGTCRQVVAVVGHAGVVLALRQVIAAPVNYARETLASPTTATMFFPMLDEASPVARLFGVIDLFVIWWIVLLAAGVSVLYDVAVRPVAFTLVGAYLALALVLAAVMVVFGGAV